MLIRKSLILIRNSLPRDLPVALTRCDQDAPEQPLLAEQLAPRPLRGVATPEPPDTALCHFTCLVTRPLITHHTHTHIQVMLCRAMIVSHAVHATCVKPVERGEVTYCSYISAAPPLTRRVPKDGTEVGPTQGDPATSRPAPTRPPQELHE